MDSKFSFLDQDGLFGDGENSQEQQMAAAPNTSSTRGGGGARMPNHYGGTAQNAPPMRPTASNNNMIAQQPSGAVPTLEAVLSGPLDGIARALAYTEKRIAASEAKVLAALREARDQKPPTMNGWIVAIIVIVSILGIAVLIGYLRKRPSAAGGTALFLQGAGAAAPAAPSIVFPAAGLAPPATFITQQ